MSSRVSNILFVCSYLKIAFFCVLNGKPFMLFTKAVRNAHRADYLSLRLSRLSRLSSE